MSKGHDRIVEEVIADRLKTHGGVLITGAKAVGGQGGPRMAKATRTPRASSGQAEPVSTQFSRTSPGTRWNARALFVTSVASKARACAAIHMSMEPMGVP